MLTHGLTYILTTERTKRTEEINNSKFIIHN